VTHLVEQKVELTQSEPVKCKIYPTSNKMQAVVDQEIDNVLAMGVIERSEAAYASRGADPGGAGGAAAPPILILVVQTYHFAPPIIPVHK